LFEKNPRKGNNQEDLWLVMAREPDEIDFVWFCEASNLLAVPAIRARRQSEISSWVTIQKENDQ
jgi:hypothetical protein